MNPEVQAKFYGYPQDARQQLESVRRLILALAAEHELGDVEETLKWGEASYFVKGGTSIRIDWKHQDPGFIKVFFHCQTSMIETCKELYRNEFSYEGKRAIVIPLSTNIEHVPLGDCLLMALRYHELKHMSLLGN